MTQYTKELSNQPIARSGAAVSKAPKKKWCHFDFMNFVKDNVHRESFGNLEEFMEMEQQPIINPD